MFATSPMSPASPTAATEGSGDQPWLDRSSIGSRPSGFASCRLWSPGAIRPSSWASGDRWRGSRCLPRGWTGALALVASSGLCCCADRRHRRGRVGLRCEPPWASLQRAPVLVRRSQLGLRRGGARSPAVATSWAAGGVAIGAAMTGAVELLARGAEWHPLEQRRQLVSQVHMEREVEALLSDQAGQARCSSVPLGVASGGDLGTWQEGRFVVVPRAAASLGLGIVGSSGSGKTVTIERLVMSCAARGRRVVLVDAKGSDPSLPERMAAAYSQPPPIAGLSYRRGRRRRSTPGGATRQAWRTDCWACRTTPSRTGKHLPPQPCVWPCAPLERRAGLLLTSWPG